LFGIQIKVLITQRTACLPQPLLLLSKPYDPKSLSN
jgi:hypothetical protein